MKQMDKKSNIELCFLECEKILWKLSNKYKNIYNGDTNEAFSCASLWLVEDYDTYDKNKSSFVTYIYKCIERKFINEAIKKKNSDDNMDYGDIEDLDECGLLVNNNENILIDENITNGKLERYSFYLENKSYLNNVKNRDYEIFRMYYYCGRNISDIAEIFNLSEIRIKEIKRKILKIIDKNKEIERNNENNL